MRDKLLCPFCNKPLQPTHRIEDEYFCENYDCPQTSITWIGTSSLWKAFADTKKKLDDTQLALNYCINRFVDLELVLDEKAKARDTDDPDLYAWAIRIKPIWMGLKEITGKDYKNTENK